LRLVALCLRGLALRIALPLFSFFIWRIWLQIRRKLLNWKRARLGFFLTGVLPMDNAKVKRPGRELY
jgi:hypothetical protein